MGSIKSIQGLNGLSVDFPRINEHSVVAQSRRCSWPEHGSLLSTSDSCRLAQVGAVFHELAILEASDIDQKVLMMSEGSLLDNGTGDSLSGFDIISIVIVVIAAEPFHLSSVFGIDSQIDSCCFIPFDQEVGCRDNGEHPTLEH